MSGVPEIDVAPLLALADPRSVSSDAVGRDVIDVARAIDAACREVGFFTVVGHGVDPGAFAALDRAAQAFFALPEATKAEIAMARGGRAWRGWFPLGGELTSGVPDRKEGLYFGEELATTDERVAAGRPLHGPNLFPARPAELRAAVLDHLDAMTRLGQSILAGMAIGLGLDARWFVEHLTADPVILFRIFHYPPQPPAGAAGPGEPEGWGVAEHTDYGLLTLLGQDGTPGLEVRARAGWTAVDARSDRFVCNIGDMLERLTGGRYRSTPHRVRNTSGVDRRSFPFFLDPSWDAVVERLPIADDPSDPDLERAAGAARRWDGSSVHDLGGTYGEYLLAKVTEVFPALAREARTAGDDRTGPPHG